MYLDFVSSYSLNGFRCTGLSPHILLHPVRAYRERTRYRYGLSKDIWGDIVVPRRTSI